MPERWISLVPIAGLVFVAAIVGIFLRASSTGLTEIWIANAVAFGLISRLPAERWPAGAAAAFVGCLLANLVGVPFGPDVFFALAFLLELSIALALFAWLRRIVKGKAITAASILATIGLVGGLAPALSGVLVTAAVPIVGMRASPHFYWIWWSGAAMGAIAVLPILATRPVKLMDAFRGRQLAALILTLVPSLAVSLAASIITQHPYLAAMIPLLVASIFTTPFVVSVASAGTIAVFVLSSFTGIMAAGPSNESNHFYVALTVLAPLAVSLLIDELRRQHKAAQQSETRWAFALESARQGVWDRDVGRGRTYVSPIWLEMLGLKSGDVGAESSSWLEHVHPDDRAAVLAADEACLSGASNTLESVFRMRHRDGRWIWILDRAKVVERGPDGRALRIIGTHSDISRDRELELALRIQLERAALATKAGGVGIWEWSMINDSLTWDDQMLALYGVERSELKGCYEDWADHLHPDDKDAATAAAAETVATGKPFDTEFRVITGRGEMRVIRALATRLTDDDGKPLMVIGTNWDVTEARTAAESLRLANESLGQFAALASHDLQTPLRHISIFAEMLERDLGAGASGDMATAISGIAASTAKMQVLVRSLLAFSRTTSRVPEPLPTAMNDVLGVALANLTPELEDTGAAVTQAPLPTLDVDPALMAQVFQNLVGNALKYRGDRLPAIEVRAQRTDSAWEISIADNGIGIDPHYAELVFEPFKRLPAAKDKPGVGIGLSLVRRILHAHGATIRLDGSYTGGSRFVLTFPAPTILLKEAG